MKNNNKAKELKVPFIGFIKNNWLRRISMIITAPFLFLLMMVLNLLLAIGIFIIGIFANIKSIKDSFLQVWVKPRVKHGEI